MVYINYSNRPYESPFKTASPNPFGNQRSAGKYDYSSKSAPIADRYEEQDQLRIRMTALEKKQESLESYFKICAVALGTIALGVATYQNWSTLNAAASNVYQKMYSLDELKAAAASGWVKFLSLFQTVTPPPGPTPTPGPPPGPNP